MAGSFHLLHRRCYICANTSTQFGPDWSPTPQGVVNMNHRRSIPKTTGWAVRIPERDNWSAACIVSRIIKNSLIFFVSVLSNKHLSERGRIIVISDIARARNKQIDEGWNGHCGCGSIKAVGVDYTTSCRDGKRRWKCNQSMCNMNNSHPLASSVGDWALLSLFLMQWCGFWFRILLRYYYDNNILI